MSGGPEFGIGRAEESSIHRDQMRRKEYSCTRAFSFRIFHEPVQFLFDFRRVTVPGDVVGREGVMRFRKMIGQSPGFVRPRKCRTWHRRQWCPVESSDGPVNGANCRIAAVG